MCFSQRVYAACSATYADGRPAERRLTSQKAAPEPDCPMSAMAHTSAAPTDSAPDAIGRCDFSGCRRSASRSETSLKR